MIQGFVLYAFAGIWAEVWRFGLGFGVMILLFAAAYFSPIWKKDFLWAGVALGVAMVFFTTGVVVGEKRVRAQWMAADVAATKQSQDSYSDAVRTVRRKPSRWLPSHGPDVDCRDCK
jgi:hypothetical protein